jgi:uncharacterized protein YjbI with pentapeptide repeats
MIFFLILIVTFSSFLIIQTIKQFQEDIPQIDTNNIGSEENASTIASSRLAGSKLDGSRLAASRLAGSRLAASTIAGSVVAGSRLAGSRLAGSKLAASTIAGSVVAGSRLAGSNLAASTIAASNLAASNLAASTVAASNLAASTIATSNLAASNLAGSNLNASNLAASTIAASNLAGSNLAASNLAASNLAASNLAASNLAGSNLAASNLAASNLAAYNLAASNLAASNLAASNLAGSNLDGSNLVDSNLSGSNLVDSNLYASNLASSNLAGSNLAGSNLAASNLVDSNLAASNLVDSNLAASNLAGSNLAGSNLYASNLYASNLYASNLAASNLSASNLAGSNLAASNLAGSNLAGSNLYASNLYASNLYASNLAGSNLDGSNLVGSNLAGSNLYDSNLVGSNLYASNLAASNLAGSNLAGSNLAGSNLYASNLYASNLAASNLAGSNLAASNLAGSNLAGSNLYASNLAGSNLAASNLAGSNLAGSNLYASNLAASNLAGSNLAGSNLAGSNLAGSALAASTVAGSNLAGSNLAASKLYNIPIYLEYRNNLSNVIALNAPVGIYSAEYYNNGILPDLTGNNKNAICSNNITLDTSSDNSTGAIANIPYIYGSVDSTITWPSDLIASKEFTICFITKYEGSNRNRILANKNVELTQSFFGHEFGGTKGYFVIDNKVLSYNANNTYYTNIDNWLVACFRTTGEIPQNNILVNGMPDGTVNIENYITPIELTINNFPYSSQKSDWALSHVLIWDTALSDNNMKIVSDALSQHLIDGKSMFNNKAFIGKSNLPEYIMGASIKAASKEAVSLVNDYNNGIYIKTVAGTGNAGLFSSEKGSDALLQNISEPSTILIDKDNNMYVGSIRSTNLFKISNGEITLLTTLSTTLSNMTNNTNIPSPYFMCWDKKSNYNVIIITCNHTYIYRYTISTNELSIFFRLNLSGIKLVSGIDCVSNGNFYISTNDDTYIYDKSNPLDIKMNRFGYDYLPPRENGYNIYIDNQDNVYFSDLSSIIMYSSSRVWSTIFVNTNPNYELGTIIKSTKGNIYVQYNYISSTDNTKRCYNIGVIESPTSIKYISGSNISTTYAISSGRQSYASNTISQENVLASRGTFASPHMIALDSNNNIYIADRYNNRIRQIYSIIEGSNIDDYVIGEFNLASSKLAGSNLAGSLLTSSLLAGSNLAGSKLTGSLVAGSKLTGSLVAGSNLAGSLVAASNLPGSLLTGSLVAGSNLAGSNLAGSNLYASNLAGSNLAGSNLYASNLAGSIVAASNLPGYLLKASNLAVFNNDTYIKTVLGTGSTSINNPTSSISINNPTAILFDNVNNMYIGCKGSGQLFKVSLDGKITLLTSLPHYPYYMCWDKTSNYNTIIITANTTSIYNYVISTNTINQFLTVLYFASGIDCDSDGNLYISTTNGVYKANVDGSAYDNNGTTSIPFNSYDSPPALIKGTNGYAIYIDSNNNIYFSQANSIVMYSSSSVWSKIFENSLYEIGAITKSTTGIIYVQYNYIQGTNRCYNIGIIENSTSIIHISGSNTSNPIIFGTQTYGANNTSQENILASSATFSSPNMIALDSNNNIYIADRYNNRIRKIYSISTSSKLAGSNLAGSNLYASTLAGSNLAGSNLYASTLAGSNLAVSNLYASTLAGSNLAGSILTGSLIAGSLVAGSNLAESNLYASNLAGSLVAGSNLAGSFVTGSNLAGSNLAASTVTGSNLAGSLLAGSNLAYYNLITRNINNANIKFYYPFDIDFKDYSTGIGIDNTGIYNGTNITISNNTTKLKKGSILFGNSTFGFPSVQFTNNGITIAFWIKLNTIPNNAEIISFNGALLSIYIDNKKLSYKINYPSIGSSIQNSIDYTFTDLDWHHFCFTFTPEGTFHIYIDYIKYIDIKSIYPSLDILETNYINNKNSGNWENNEYMNANMNQLIVYNRVLTETEIGYLFNDTINIIITSKPTTIRSDIPLMTPTLSPSYNLYKSNLAGSLVTGSLVAGSNVAGSLIAASNLPGSLLTASRLTGSLVVGSNLAGSNLAGSLVAGSNLAGSNLTGSLIAASNLPGSLLTASTLAGSNLTSSNLVAGSNLAGSLLDSSRLAYYNLVTRNINNANIKFYYPFNVDLKDYSTGTGVSNTSFDGGTSISITTATTKLSSGSMLVGNTGLRLPGLQFTNNGITIAFWIKFNEIPNNSTILVFSRLFFINIYNKKLGYTITNPSIGTSTDNYIYYTFNDLEWHHICFTFTPEGTFSIYVDYVKYTIDSPIYPTLDSLTFNFINNYYVGDFTYFNGFINQFIVYNRTLTETEIYYLFNNTSNIIITSNQTTVLSNASTIPPKLAPSYNVSASNLAGSLLAGSNLAASNLPGSLLTSSNLAASKFFSYNIPDYLVSRTNLSNLISVNAPIGIYSAEYYSNGILPDLTGNNKNAICSINNITLENSPANSAGATASIPYIYGGINSTITWPSNIITSDGFTICFITRYTGSNKNTILINKNMAFGQSFFGHDFGYKGYFVLESVALSTGFNNINNQNWLVSCFRTKGTTPTNNILVDGIPSGSQNINTYNTPIELTINNVETVNNWIRSDWGLSHVLIWNNALNDNEMFIVSSALSQYLIDGKPIFNNNILIKQANLTQSIIAASNLPGSLLTGSLVAASNLPGSLVAASNLAGSLVTSSLVAGSNLAGSLVTGSLVAGSNLAGSLVAGSNLAGSNLTGSLVAGSNLAGSLVTGSNLAGSKLTSYNLGIRNINNNNIIMYYPFDIDLNDYSTGIGVNNTQVNNGITVPISTTTTKLLSGSALFSNTSIQLPGIKFTTNGVTIAFWIKFNTIPNYNAMIIRFDTKFYININNGKLGFIISNSLGISINSSINYTFNDLEWHHICFTFTPEGTFSIYVDYVKYTINSPIYPTLDALSYNYINNYTHRSYTYMNANINQFIIYNRVLTETEISYLFNNTNKIIITSDDTYVLSLLDSSKLAVSNLGASILSGSLLATSNLPGSLLAASNLAVSNLANTRLLISGVIPTQLVNGKNLYTITTTTDINVTKSGWVWILVVGGGGSSPLSLNPMNYMGERLGGGGGGGGGVYENTSYFLEVGTYTITVISTIPTVQNNGENTTIVRNNEILFAAGGGGAGGSGIHPNHNGKDGSSVSATIGAVGGSGGGGSTDIGVIGNGGNGGNGTANSITIKSTNGASSLQKCCGGGGGAVENGGVPIQTILTSTTFSFTGGKGGDGLSSTITGSALIYGAGGGGAGLSTIGQSNVTQVYRGSSNGNSYGTGGSSIVSKSGTLQSNGIPPTAGVVIIREL